MTDYNKQTVAQLRQLLKDRSIPSTGLQRKAQIIERLQEADQAAEKAASESDDAPVEAPESESQLDAPPDPVEQVQQESGGTIVDSEGKEPDQTSSNPKGKSAQDTSPPMTRRLTQDQRQSPIKTYQRPLYQQLPWTPIARQSLISIATPLRPTA